MQFSVLISVYFKEDPAYLEEALLSLEKQTMLPAEIVLIKDGPLNPQLDAVIEQYSEHSTITYKIVSLSTNKGLGSALNEGLTHCSYTWIARMDSDDIALPERFEKQFTYVAQNPEIDILGSWICEFDIESDECVKKRRVPALHTDIVNFAKYRNPMNHMTVLFRKAAVEDAGGYMPMNGFEDYFLWMRMLMKGRQFANLPYVLVKARTGSGMIARRQGWQYVKDELTLEKAAYQMGFWSFFDISRNMVTRVFPRMLPVVIVEKLYNLLRKF
jgi:glycosyltransferase involved in cell wall biosynthesis